MKLDEFSSIKKMGLINEEDISSTKTLTAYNENFTFKLL